MNGLIVTADDFGAAVAVNDAVELAHREGVLTAASLMVAGAAAEDAIARARRLPNLRVGLHLVLVEGRSMLSPRDIPGLVDGAGRLRRDMGRLGVDVFVRPSVRAQLRREISAQFQAFRATGLPLDHVNAHKHFHLHPTVAGIVLEVGRTYGMRSMRVPAEQRSTLAAAEAGGRPRPALTTAPWAMLLRRRLRAAGMTANDYLFGLAWSGQMTAARAAGLVRRLSPGLSEIYFHPAAEDAFPDAEPGYRYRQELDALRSPIFRDAIRDSNIRLGGFSDFASATVEAAPAARRAERAKTPGL